jgi:branched-chain amino acid transport system permease protein
MNLGGIFVDGLRAAIGVPAAAFALAAIGLNLQFGYTGLLNFGQVGFLLAGAYGTAVAADHGLPFPLAILVGILASIALALLLGLPTLRLRGDFLAIVTIATAEILRQIVRAQQLDDITGGVRGLQGWAEPFYTINPIPKGSYGVGDLTFNERGLWMILVGWALAVLATLFVRRLARSPWGRVVKAIRADEDAPRSVGKDVFGYKLQSLAIGGTIGALGGILIAIDAQFTNPDYWLSALTFYAYVALILGGTATTWGPIVGSMLFWFITQAFETGLRQAIESGWFGDVVTTTDTGPLRFALVGLALMALMAFRPQGIFGNKADLEVIDR